MVAVAAQAAASHSFDEKSLRLSLVEISHRSYGDEAMVNEALEEGWKQDIGHAMADRIVTQAEDARLSPNPPMRCGLGVGTKGEGHGSATVRARFQQMGPVAVGSCRSGRQWRTTAAALGEIGGTACSRRPSRSGLARVGGDVWLGRLMDQLSRASTKHASGAEQKCTTREVIGQRKCPRQLFGRSVT